MKKLQCTFLTDGLVGVSTVTHLVYLLALVQHLESAMTVPFFACTCSFLPPVLAFGVLFLCYRQAGMGAAHFPSKYVCVISQASMYGTGRGVAKMSYEHYNSTAPLQGPNSKILIPLVRTMPPILVPVGG